MAAIRLVSLAVLFLYLSGCTSYPPQLPPVHESGGVADDAANGEQDVPVPPTGAASQAPDTKSATVALLRQSQRAHESGDEVEAVAYVERAIRLNPRQADLWLRLAKLHLAQADLEAAIQYANKTISLAGQRIDWRREAWLVIADARAAQGDIQTAQDIRNKWQTYQG